MKKWVAIEGQPGEQELAVVLDDEGVAIASGTIAAPRRRLEDYPPSGRNARTRHSSVRSCGLRQRHGRPVWEI